MTDTKQPTTDSLESLISHETAMIEALEGEKAALQETVNQKKSKSLGAEARVDYYKDQQRILEIDSDIALKTDYVDQLRHRIAGEQKFRQEILEKFHENFGNMLDKALMLYSNEADKAKQIEYMKQSYQAGKLQDNRAKVDNYLALNQLIAQKQKQNG